MPRTPGSKKNRNSDNSGFDNENAINNENGIDNENAVNDENIIDDEDSVNSESGVNSEKDIPKSTYMMEKCMVIGKNIRNHRKQRRFSVENLAEFLELSASYIGLLERGNRCPSLKIVYKLCDLFGLNPDALLAPDASDKEMVALRVAEDPAAYNVKVQFEAITSLLKTLNESELDFVIDTIKSLKKIGK